MQQRVRVSLARLRIEGGQDPLVAGHFQIPAEQEVAKPGRGIEPEQGKKQAGQELFQRILLYDVHFLVGEEEGSVFRVGGRGQTDDRRPDAEDEGDAEIGGIEAAVFARLGVSEKRKEGPKEIRSRSAAIPHRGTKSRLGIFRSTRRRANTARIRKLADQALLKK